MYVQCVRVSWPIHMALFNYVVDVLKLPVGVCVGYLHVRTSTASVVSQVTALPKTLSSHYLSISTLGF